MANPIIVGRQEDLNTKELFNLMKDVMRLDQTISLTTVIRNGTLKNSPGIILRQGLLDIWTPLFIFTFFLF